MKCSKIRNAEKSVCTAEQKIAYNYAFMWSERLKAIESSDMSEITKSNVIQDIVTAITKGMDANGISDKYNPDVVIHAFRNGWKTYAAGFEILDSYKKIGETFPILYEIE